MRCQVDNRVARLAAEQFGIVTAADLRACGLTKMAVTRRVRAGHLHPLYRGVYAVGHPNPPLEGRFLAAVKACGPGAVLSHFAAAAHHGFVTWDDRYPEVTTTRSATHARIRVHRTRTLEQRDVTRHKNIPTTTPARTLVDLSSMLQFEALRRATREARAQRLISIRQLTEALNRLPHRPGTSKLAQILALGIPPTRSELEDAVLDLITRGGFAPPDVNVPIHVSGRRVIPDFRWPAQRLVIEADGAVWHDHRLAREDDAERQALLEADGERVVRVTWDQTIRRRTQTLARLQQAGAPKLNGS